MINQNTAHEIRVKKLGLLLRDARRVSNKSVEECAQILGIPVHEYEAYEFGENSPSLAEIEVLAYFFQIPFEHFWGQETLSKTKRVLQPADTKRLIALRIRQIGTILKQTREEQGLALESISQQTGIPVDRINDFESNEAPVPLPDLEVLCGALGRPLEDFQDHGGLIGTWSNQQRSIQGFLGLSPDLQAFISQPINRPYLELAQRLSEMSVEKLRSVAEGLLEITL